MSAKPRIISASRRTDIPAYYTPWFMQRLHEGYCLVPSPYAADRVTRVSLRPQDVTAIVFWTRDPAPLLPHLGTLRDLGIPALFHMTITGYPGIFEPDARRHGGPANADRACDALLRLAEEVGPRCVVWRYDPVILSRHTPVTWHENTFGTLTARLAGHVDRGVTAFMEPYGQTRRRLRTLNARGAEVTLPGEHEKRDILDRLSSIAQENGMPLSVCCAAIAGEQAAGCVDAEWIFRATGRVAGDTRHSGQRTLCRCLPSFDIGVYGTCPRGCVYCYAGGTTDNRRHVFMPCHSHAPAFGMPGCPSLTVETTAATRDDGDGE